MSFLGGLFLLALPLIAIPVVIHFMRRRRREVTPWGAMQFLKVSNQRDSKLSNLDRWLLMLLRILAIACLIVALAQPAFHFFGSSRPSLTPQVLMIDDTRSTLAIDASGKETFEAIRQAAIKWIDEVPTGTPVQAWLVGSPPRRLGVPFIAGESDQPTVRRDIQSWVPRGGSADFAENIRRVVSSATEGNQNNHGVEAGPSSLPPRFDFWLLTDTGNAGWNEKLSPIQLSGHQRNRMHLVRFDGASQAATQTFQLSVESVQPDRARIFRGGTARFAATISNHGGVASPAIECVWKRDGETFATSTLPSLDARARTTVEADLILQRSGTTPITLELKRPGNRPLGDTLAADDSSGTVIRVMDRQPVLVIVGKSTEVSTVPTESDYLGAALGQNFGSWKSPQNERERNDPNRRWQSLYRPVVKFDDELGEVQWQNFPVIILLSDAEPPKSVEKRLIAAVRAGAGLWMTLGSKTDRELRTNFLSMLGLQPVDTNASPIGDLVVHTDVEKMDRIHPPETNDEIIAALADTERLDLDEIRIRRRFRLLIDPSDEHRVVLRTFDGDALAVMSSVSHGRVVVQSLPLDPSWSNFPLSNSFVVWVSELLDDLAESKAEQHNLMLGQMLRAEVSDIDHGYAIRSSDGMATEVIALPNSTDTERSTGVIRYQETDRPGLHTLIDLDVLPENKDGEPSISFWISANPNESEITTTNADTCSRLAAHPQISITSGRDDFNPAAEFTSIEPKGQGRPKHPLWPWLLLGMFIAVVLETFLAGYAALRRYGRFQVKDQDPSTVQSSHLRGHRESARSNLETVVKVVVIGLLVFVGTHSTFAQSSREASAPREASATSDEVSIQEGMSTEGLFGTNTAIVVLVFVCLAASWWLFHQRELLGNSTTAFVACLRLIVIAAAIWMLMEPNWTRTETLSRPSEILLLADASASMETIDSLDSATARLWSHAIERQPNDHVHLQSAIFHLKIAMQNLDRSGQPSIDSLKQSLKRLELLTAKQSVSAASAKLAIQTATESAEEATAATDSAGKRALIASHTDAMQNALVELDSLTRLSRKSISQSAPVERTRKEYVSELLDQIEERWATESAENDHSSIRLRRAVFSGHVDPSNSAANGSWKERLQTNADLDSQVDTANDDPRTDISGALSFVGSMATSRRIAAVVLVSEGQHNAASELSPVEVAMGLPDVPVFTVSIGDTARRKDVSIHRVNAPPIVYTDDSPVIEVIVSGYRCENDSVDVTLSLGEKIIERKAVSFPSSQADVAVRFDVPRHSPGRHEYSISVNALDDEINLQNNKGYAAIETIRSKLYVLVADGRPRWESRYLEQLLRRDSRVVLDKVLLKPTIKTTIGTNDKPFPEEADAWSKFDVVVLGDLPPTSLTPLVREAMVQYVKSGGRLIVLAGQQHMPADYVSDPWFDLLPVTNVPLRMSASQRPAPTMDGMLTSMFRLQDSIHDSGLVWKESMSGPIPGFVSPYHAAKPTATVLATLALPDNWTSDGYAVTPMPSDDNAGLASWLAIHRVGRGRVAYLSSPVTYRLRIRNGDKFHHQFWGQIIRYMTSSDLAVGDGAVRVQTDRSQYDEGEKPHVRVRMRMPNGQPMRGAEVPLLYSAVGDDATPKVAELKEDKQVAGTYVAVLPAVPVGVYHAWVETTAVSEDEKKPTPVTFTVQALGGLEALRTEANPMLLKEIAETTGGFSIDPALVCEIPNAVSLKPEVSQRREAKPLWNRWSSLGLIVGCLSMEWFVRRRRGLV